MTDTTPVRADVPIHLHPDALASEAKALDVEGTIGRHALAAGREALAEAYRFYGAVEAAERAMQDAAPSARRRQHPDGTSDYLGDLRMVSGRVRRFTGMEEEFAAASAQAFDRASRLIDRRRAELEQARDNLAQRVAEALSDPGARSPTNIALAQEVRAHVRGLPDAKRVTLVREAIAEGDRATFAAVASAPPFLSGLTAELVAALREDAAHAWAPRDHAQLRATEAAIGRVNAAHAAMLERFGRTQDLRDTPKARASRKLAELGRG